MHSSMFQEKTANNRFHRKKGKRGIWQRRYWEHLIKDGQDFELHVNYIHYNPVKHGHVRAPVDWRYSSIHQYIRQGIVG